MNTITGIGNKMIQNDYSGVKQSGSENSFADRLKGLLEDVNLKQNEADESTEKVIKGELGIHEGMLSVQKADISFRYLVKIREQVMQAYNEVRKMAI